MNLKVFLIFSLLYSLLFESVSFGQRQDSLNAIDLNSPSGKVEVTFRPFSKIDTSVSPLRACVLRTALPNQKSYRIFVVEFNDTSFPDTTNTRFIYRFVSKKDTLKEAFCSLPNSIKAVKSVVEKLKNAESNSIAFIENPDFETFNTTNKLGCNIDLYYTECFITESSQEVTKNNLWDFKSIPFVTADSTDFGLPDKSLYIKNNPTCMPCKFPSNVYTIVDELERRTNRDPFYLIKAFGKEN